MVIYFLKSHTSSIKSPLRHAKFLLSSTFGLVILLVVELTVLCYAHNNAKGKMVPPFKVPTDDLELGLNDLTGTYILPWSQEEWG